MAVDTRPLRPVVEVHAPAPAALAPPARDLVEQCDLHPTADRPAQCLVVRLGLDDRIDLGRPHAAVPGRSFLPFGRSQEPGRPWTGRAWDDVAHVSALTASLRVDPVTREVLVTNLSEHDDIVLTPLDAEGATLLDAGVSVLRPVPGRDRQLRRPSTASLVHRYTRVEARLETRTAHVWVELLAALPAAEWFPKNPAAAVRRPKVARTSPRTLDTSLHRSAIDGFRSSAPTTTRAARDAEVCRRERDRVTALVVAMFRTADGITVLREFFDDPTVQDRLARFDTIATKLHRDAQAAWSEHVRQADAESSKAHPKPQERLPLNLASQVQDALVLAENAVEHGGFSREPAHLFVAVDVGRGPAPMRNSPSIDRTGNWRLDHLWQRLAATKSRSGRSVRVGQGTPGGSAESYPLLLDLVTRSLDFTFTGPGLRSELMGPVERLNRASGAARVGNVVERAGRAIEPGLSDP